MKVVTDLIYVLLSLQGIRRTTFMKTIYVHDSSQSCAAFIPAKLIISRISRIFRDLLSCKANFIVNVDLSTRICFYFFSQISLSSTIFCLTYLVSELFSINHEGCNRLNVLLSLQGIRRTTFMKTVFTILPNLAPLSSRQS